MEFDFTLKQYQQLLSEIQSRFSIIKVCDYNSNSTERTVILRHDVDKKIKYALQIAKLEYEMNISSSFFFPKINAKSIDIIMEIQKYGHEIGYHYKDLSENKGDFKKAIESFKNNLKKFNELFSISSICMHGAPMSKYNNLNLWQRYSYKEYGIKIEPYIDIDYNKYLYLTDTGRRWNGNNVNIRDKIIQSSKNVNVKRTIDLIKLISNDTIPKNMIILVHPQRWTNNPISWIIELIFQNIKNIFKHILLLYKKYLP